MNLEPADAEAQPQQPQRPQRPEPQSHVARPACSVNDIQGARVCKQASYTIYKQLDELYKHTKETESENVSIPIELLRSMRQSAKEINRAISQFTRAIGEEYSRAAVEQLLLKHNMHADILDREAAFTETLEAISSLNTDEGVASSTTGIAASLSSAIKMVQHTNLAMRSLKDESVFESNAIECCIRARDAS
jgi:hypothetical protein